MKGGLENFVYWTRLKIRIHFQDIQERPYFKEREIWWVNLGVNVGFEQDGKGDNFERPILILKKFGERCCGHYL